MENAHNPSPTEPVSLSHPDKLQVRAPHFPYAYGLDVERFADLVYVYTSSLFSCPETKSARSICENAAQKTKSSPKEIRAAVDTLNAQLRVNSLELEVLRMAMMKVEEARDVLESNMFRKRDELDKELQNPELETRRNIRLPPELIQRICELSYDDNIDVSFTQNDANIWGDVVYKSMPFTVPITGPQDLAFRKHPWTKVSQFSFEFSLDHPLDVKKISRILTNNRWLLQKRIEVILNTHPNGRKNCLRFLLHCKDLSSSMERLWIDTEIYGFPGGGLVSSHPGCQGCTDNVFAPRCREVEVPLQYLPCIGPMLNRVHILIIDHVNTPSGSSPPGFASYFRSLDCTYLQTLSLEGLNDNEAYNRAELFFAGAPGLVVPNLKNLRLAIQNVDGRVITLILNNLLGTATKLQNLELYNVFWSRPNEFQIADKIALTKMLTLLDAKCRQLQKLSFYAPFEQGDDDVTDDGNSDSEGLYRQQQQIVDALVDHMAASQGSSESDIMFPKLNHLTVPFTKRIDKYQTDHVLGFLVYRRQNKLPLHTLEVSMRPHDESFLDEMCHEMELESMRLGLQVHDIVRSISEI